MESGKNITTQEGFEAIPVTRDQILELEEALKELPQVDADKLTFHHFAPGIYTRELFMPAGLMATGKIHKHELQNILVFGTVRITTDNGVEELTGPRIFNSRPGTKKAVYAITDSLILNIHPTELTNLEEIEAEFIAPSFEALEQEKQACLGSQ